MPSLPALRAAVRPRTTLPIAGALALALTATPGVALAHGMRSAYLELDELEGGATMARLRVTVPQARARPVLGDCALAPLPGTSQDVDGVTRSFVARCGRPLAGLEVGVTGLGVELEEAVVRVTTASGEVFSGVLTGAEPTYRVPAAGAAAGALRRYLAAGVTHVLSGLDHLLFLLLVVLHLRRLRPILLAETAFSLSHAIAFALTTSGLLRVPAAPVEAAIAGSLVLLALDVRAPSGPSSRATALLALGFGAVHGLGFAGGLRELGVPDRELGAAVLGFGLGVELGQVAFVLTTWAALSALCWSAHRVCRRRWPRRRGQRELGGLGADAPARASDGARRAEDARRAAALARAGEVATRLAVTLIGALATAWLCERAAVALAL